MQGVRQSVTKGWIYREYAHMEQVQIFQRWSSEYGSVRIVARACRRKAGCGTFFFLILKLFGTGGTYRVEQCLVLNIVPRALCNLFYFFVVIKLLHFL